MTDPRSPWSDWYNAEVYNDYVHGYPIYRRLNRHLAELAEIGTARRVLDLACGAGATAQACLRRLPRDGELVGVDGSEAMVELARVQVTDPRARFEVARAARVDRVVAGPFDRAVCNTAFWQFPTPRTVLAHLARLLEPGALFVFNVPAERVPGEESQVHAFQIALARAIEARTGRPFDPAPSLIDPAKLRRWLDATGFELVGSERFVYPARQEELVELMRIPAMIAPLTPGLTPEVRQAVVRRAGERTDPGSTVEVPWIYYRIRRR